MGIGVIKNFMTEIRPEHSAVPSLLTLPIAVATWPEIVATAITSLSEADPIMAAAIERVGPCTLVPNPNLFETLVDAIVSQQISVKAADAIMARPPAPPPRGPPPPPPLLAPEHYALRPLCRSNP